MNIPKIDLEIIGEVNVYLGMGIQIVTAIFLGGLVGWDREQKMKAAGIKTNILICIGATLYTIVSIILQKNAGGMADPNRVGAQIVSGIGFLGAGAILQGRRGIIGLTTAATIWVVAAIGFTIGAGFPVIATIFTVTTLLVLKTLQPMYFFIELRKHLKNYHIEILSHGSVKHNVKEIILNEIDIISSIQEKILDEKKDERLLSVYVNIHPRKIMSLSNDLRRIIRVDKVEYHNVDHDGSLAEK